MDSFVEFLWSDVILGIVGFFGNVLTSIHILGISLLSWIVGIVVLSGLATIVLSVRPNFSLDTSTAARMDDNMRRANSNRRKYERDERIAEKRRTNWGRMGNGRDL